MNLLNNLKGNKLYSILTGTCPVCHEESMYKDDNPYHVSQLFDMHERCSNCHLAGGAFPTCSGGALHFSSHHRQAVQKYLGESLFQL